jgi:hypothetical protein
VIFRNALLKTVKPATVLRVLKVAKAALNLAAKLDHRISNRNAWHDGLSGVTVNEEPENRVLEDAEVRKLVEAAYALRPDFGLFIDVLAVTGTRTSQATIRTVYSNNRSGKSPLVRLLARMSCSCRSNMPLDRGILMK